MTDENDDPIYNAGLNTAYARFIEKHAIGVRIHPATRFVTLSALISRINRKLSEENRSLRKSRGQGMINNVGDYYVLDIYRNSIHEGHVDPEEMGRELKVLADWEQVAWEKPRHK
jgi:hypothetical protein